MPQPLLPPLSRSIVKDRNLLKTRMKITAYNQHDVGSFSSPWSFRHLHLLKTTSQRRYPINQSEESALPATTPHAPTLFRILSPQNGSPFLRSAFPLPRHSRVDFPLPPRLYNIVTFH